MSIPSRMARRCMICGAFVLILTSGLSYLLLPVEYLRVEDGILESPSAAVGGNRRTTTFFDDGLIGHTQGILPPSSALSFSLSFPFPPLRQFHLSCSTLPAVGGSKGDLRVEIRSEGSGDPRVLYSSRNTVAGVEISIPLDVRSRKTILSLITSDGVILRDLRVIPMPLLPMAAGLVMLGAAAIFSRRAAGRRPGPVSSRRRRFVFVPVLLVMMALFIAGTIEAFIRLFPARCPTRIHERIRSYPLQPRQYERMNNSNIFDSELGFRRRPRYAVDYAYSDGDLFHLGHTTLKGCTPPQRVRARWDEEGFRVTEGSGRPEIVFLGDSFVEAMTAPATFCDVVQELTGVGCLNLGLAGTGTTQQVMMMERFGFRGHPRAVVQVFFEANDLIDNKAFDTYRRCGLCDGSILWAQLYYPFPMGFRHAPLDEVRVLKFLPPAWFQSWPGYLVRGNGGAAGREEAPGESGGDASPAALNDIELPSLGAGTRIALCPHTLRMLASEIETEWPREGWEIAQRDLLRARDECMKRGVAYVVCYMPAKERIYLPHVRRSLGPEGTGRLLRALVPDLASEIEARVERGTREKRRSFAEFAARHGIPFIDLCPAFERESDALPLLYYCNDTHPSPRGIRVVGEAISRWLGERMPDLLASRRQTD